MYVDTIGSEVFECTVRTSTTGCLLKLMESSYQGQQTQVSSFVTVGQYQPTSTRVDSSFLRIFFRELLREF
jgi:hypothetical protein